jgi:hypothetical protein
VIDSYKGTPLADLSVDNFVDICLRDTKKPKESRVLTACLEMMQKNIFIQINDLDRLAFLGIVLAQSSVPFFN